MGCGGLGRDWCPFARKNRGKVVVDWPFFGGAHCQCPPPFGQQRGSAGLPGVLKPPISRAGRVPSDARVGGRCRRGCRGCVASRDPFRWRPQSRKAAGWPARHGVAGRRKVIDAVPQGGAPEPAPRMRSTGSGYPGKHLRDFQAVFMSSSDKSVRNRGPALSNQARKPSHWTKKPGLNSPRRGRDVRDERHDSKGELRPN